MKNKDILGKKMLVVEDSDSIRNQLSEIYEEYGFTVVSAQNGQEALQFIIAEKGDPQTKLVAISSDVNMPKLDGAKLLEIVRSDDIFQNLKFFLITANKNEIIKIAADQLDVDGFFLKPFDKEKIFTTLNACFSQDPTKSSR